MRFDPDKPHAQVYGVPGVSFQQSGKYFRRDGSLVDGDPDRDRELREIKSKIGDASLEPEVREAMRDRLVALGASSDAVVAPVPEFAAVASMVAAAAEVAEPVAKPSALPSDDMRRAENKALKAQMEIYSEPWVSVAHARAFLEGRGE